MSGRLLLSRSAIRQTGITAALIAVAFVAGCGQDLTTEDLEREMNARPRMEQTLDRYDAMRRDMVRELEAEIGGLDWYASHDLLRMSRSGCSTGGAVTEAQEVSMVGLTADGTYDRSDWERAVAIVRDVGSRYGFGPTMHVVDRPGDLKVVSDDQYGARYTFGMAVNSILTVRTGCHLWSERPDLDYTRPSPLGDPPPGNRPMPSATPPGT